MKAVLQRVKKADITIDGVPGGSIPEGLVCFVCIMEGDTEKHVDLMVRKILALRIFEDENERMNRSVLDIGGSLLLVSNFTLGADCRKGTRPSFDGSAKPSEAIPLYDRFVEQMKKAVPGKIVTGKFGADMQVLVLNDGPVNILFDTDLWRSSL